MPRFVTGDRVRISDRVESRHHRVPSYVKGRSGIVDLISPLVRGSLKATLDVAIDHRVVPENADDLHEVGR